MYVWSVIPDFPNYSVSNVGLVKNNETHRILRQSANQSGVMTVGMMRDGIQHRRGIARLVANSFLPNLFSRRFDTLIHLDNNPDHNFVENLAWRPKSFCYMYRQQFNVPRLAVTKPIVLESTGEIFELPLYAAIRFGELERAVVMSAMNDDYRVFPHNHKYFFID